MGDGRLRVYESTVMEAPVARVWPVVRDFNGLPAWLPGIESSEIEDGGRLNRPGAVRAMTLPDGRIVREKLLVLCDGERSISYAILSGPVPVVDYVATMRLFPITDTGATFGEWFADFDAPPGVEPDKAIRFVGRVFKGGWAGLKTHVGER